MDLSEARLWCKNFAYWYNHEHHHSGIKFLTPQQRHSGIDAKIVRKRNEVYEAAKARHPERWTKSTRDWSLPEKVYLNPKKNQSNSEICETVQNVS